MSFERTARMNMLYDFYGALLTERQRRLVHLYYEDDFSLGEISEEAGISRQGVHDALRKAAAAMETYEAKLGLAEKFRDAEAAVSRVTAAIDALAADRAADAPLRTRLSEIRGMADAIRAAY